MQKNDVELDLKDLLSYFWKQKWIISFIIGLFAAGSVLYAISLPNVYQAEVLLAPASDDSQISGAANQLGGIAAIAGINLGSNQGTSRVDLALQTLKSRKFAQLFIEKRDILVPLMALDSWNINSGEIKIDPELYDVTDGRWVREVQGNRSVIPTAWEAYKEFEQIVQYEKDPATGFVKISIQFQSPLLAQQWATWLVEDLNLELKKNDINEFKANVTYIENQLKTTKIAGMQTVFYQLIEEQTKKLMLAEVQEEYVFKVIDPAVFPEEKFSPSRAIICILGTFIGFVLALLITLVNYIMRDK